MARKYVEAVVSEITFKGACGAQHTYTHAWDRGKSERKNWMYKRIAQEQAEDGCQDCVRERGGYVRPENQRSTLPTGIIPSTPPSNCPSCNGQREWDLRRNQRVAVCLFCGMVLPESLFSFR